MKKSKKLLTLVLALMLSLTTLVMSAAATEAGKTSVDGEVIPTICPRCGWTAELVKYEPPTTYLEMKTCSRNSTEHLHAIERGYSLINCSICGYFYDRIENDFGCVTVNIA